MLVSDFIYDGGVRDNWIDTSTKLFDIKYEYDGFSGDVIGTIK